MANRPPPRVEVYATTDPTVPAARRVYGHIVHPDATLSVIRFLGPTPESVREKATTFWNEQLDALDAKQANAEAAAERRRAAKQAPVALGSEGGAA